MKAKHGRQDLLSVRGVSHNSLNCNRGGYSLSAATIRAFRPAIYNARFVMKDRGGCGSVFKARAVFPLTQSGSHWQNQMTVERRGIASVLQRFLLEEMHGGGIQLPDGRIVFLYTHRGPTYRGGERAKVSYNEGRTWRDELYFMTATPSYPGYSGSCVLPSHLADGKPG